MLRPGVNGNASRLSTAETSDIPGGNRAFVPQSCSLESATLENSSLCRQQSLGFGTEP